MCSAVPGRWLQATRGRGETGAWRAPTLPAQPIVTHRKHSATIRSGRSLRLATAQEPRITSAVPTHPDTPAFRSPEQPPSPRDGDGRALHPALWASHDRRPTRPPCPTASRQPRFRCSAGSRRATPRRHRRQDRWRKNGSDGWPWSDPLSLGYFKPALPTAASPAESNRSQRLPCGVGMGSRLAWYRRLLRTRSLAPGIQRGKIACPRRIDRIHVTVDERGVRFRHWTRMSPKSRGRAEKRTLMAYDGGKHAGYR